MFSFRNTALALAFSLTAVGAAAAQDTAPVATGVAKNTFFVELLGNAGLYSLNYERFFTPRLGLRVGGMYIQAEDEGDEVAVGLFPIMATYLLGEGNSHFETGVGIGIATAGVESTDLGDEWGSAVYGTATLGYRYQKPAGGVMFRVGFTPVVASGNVFPWVGASVGYAF
ncbi:MAG TPA: hypothetical protein VEX86_00765 [Longimicrobium sp.]|nr:hypothetical protein [Longimicrobium sp.]